MSERVSDAASNDWICPMCDHSYRFSTHPFCLRKVLQERHGLQAELLAARESLTEMQTENDLLQSERERLRELLRDCHSAIWTAVGCEDGLDCNEGIPLMEAIDAAVPGCKKPEGPVI